MPRTKESGIELCPNCGAHLEPLEAERDALRETLEEIERAASFDRGHPTFDKIASKARAALEFLP